MARAFREYADTCTACATSGHGPWRNFPPSSVSGLPNAIEWTTPSSPSTCSRTASASPSRWDSSVTSSSSTGGSVGSRLAIRRVMPSARPKLEIRTVAPCSWATFATEKPIEESMVTPATRIRLPSRMPMMLSLLSGGRGVASIDGGRRDEGQWPMPRPPSTGITAPVTYAAPGEASQTTAEATSSGEA